MVDFLTLLKGTFRKFQLQAEVALLDRDATNRQRAFGIELFDLIEAQRVTMRAQIEKTMEGDDPKSDAEEVANANTNSQSANGSVTASDVETVMRVFQTIENEIREPLDACRKDIQDLRHAARGLPIPEILLKRRKEEFGIAVWPIVSKPKWLHESLEEDLKKALADHDTKERSSDGSSNGSKNGTELLGNLVTGAIKSVVEGTKTTITKAIGKLSPEEREVEACVTIAKQEVAKFEEQKIEKLSEIEELVSGGTTLECC